MSVFYLLFFMVQISISSNEIEDLPDPRLILVGATGVGKSSLANALLGCDPNSDGCLFEVCGSVDSCTKKTTYGTGAWLGQLGTGKNVTIVDTPGFGDSDQEDNLLIDEMMDVLRNSIGYANRIILVLNGQETRFNEALQSTLRQMSALFGDQWWEFMTIGVSFWSYDQDAIDDRNEFCTNYPSKCKNEAWFVGEFNTQLQEKFHLTRNFTFVFTDSWSQTIPNNQDPVQQDHWLDQTQALWDIVQSSEETFQFKTIDDILEENQAMKEEIKWLNDVITNNISELANAIDHNSDAIDHNSDDIGLVSSRVTLNEVDIDVIEKTTIPQVVENFDTEIKTIEVQIEEDLSQIRSEIEEMHLAPVGTVTGWLGGRSIQLPSGWQLCDGSSILSGPMSGQNTPNLNGDGLFLRGGQPADAWVVESDQIRQHGHHVTDPGHKHTDTGHTHMYTDMYNQAERSDDANDRTVGSDATTSTSRQSDTSHAVLTKEVTNIQVTDITGAAAGSETRPKNMAVEWIIRIV